MKLASQYFVTLLPQKRYLIYCATPRSIHKGPRKRGSINLHTNVEKQLHIGQKKAPLRIPCTQNAFLTSDSPWDSTVDLFRPPCISLLASDSPCCSSVESIPPLLLVPDVLPVLVEPPVEEDLSSFPTAEATLFWRASIYVMIGGYLLSESLPKR